MSLNGTKTIFIVLVVSGAVLISGCGGTKLLKDPLPHTQVEPLAQSSDPHLQVSLDWIIVRDGPGSWAKNVDWDEYLIRVDNRVDHPVRLQFVTVVDSLGTRIVPGLDRKQLVRASKRAVRRYEGHGLQVKAGLGAGTLASAGVASGATAAALLASGPLALSSSAATAAAGGVVLLPVLTVGGIVRGMNNGRVNDQILARQTRLPLELAGNQTANLAVFFPLTPSPREIEIGYIDACGSHALRIDTRVPLDSLHLGPNATAVDGASGAP